MHPSIAVVGPGAIGTTVAAALHEARRSPAVYGRTARDALELRTDDAHVVVPGPVETDPARVAGRVDVVFLGVKATQIEAAAPWLAALCDADTVVCMLQNGVEQVAMVAPHTNGAAVVPSVVWFPAVTQPDGSVWLRGEPRLTLPDTAAAHRVRDVLDGTRCTVETTPDFAEATWRKLLQNAAAGLMVLTGRRSGMFDRDDLGDLAVAYLREGLAVARAEGAVLGDEVPHEILAAFRAYPADLGTSILVDREAGRPLEWDVRNGVIQRLGRAHGIRTPISDVVVPLLAAASEGPG
jgi:2-dehydropantoate 2-reductase